MAKKNIKVIIAKPGLDGHELGAKMIARVLRDAGMEVIYTGMRQTPQMIAEAALQEDADVIGLSILSGAHIGLTSRLFQYLKDKNVEGVMVLVGGIVPEDDIPTLKEMGVTGVFGPGTDTREVIELIRKGVAGKSG